MQKSTTEQSSKYDDLEKMSIDNLLHSINNEDKTVPFAVEKAIPQIIPLVDVISKKMKENSDSRLFYIGSGTSGRLGIVDASECPPTFGVQQGMIVGIIAGGDKAIRVAQEYAEDNEEQAWKDLQEYNINENDVVIGITASGNTPYVIAGLRQCKLENIATGCIVCNKNTKLAAIANYPIEVIVGPEFVTGSTRMKAGTAQKLVLNMITTSVMIQLGRVKGNKMIDMQFTNNKLINRGALIIQEEFDIDYQNAQRLLLKYGSVREALDKSPVEEDLTKFKKSKSVNIDSVHKKSDQK